MAESFALKYRPRRFSDMVGQKSVSVILEKSVQLDTVHTANLFEGPRGTGKTSAARILAAALNCEADGSRPCGNCPSCKSVELGNSLDVLEIDAASNGLVGDIRELRDMVLYSVGGRKRVVLLDEAHSMSREAFNSLLKTLEEPPPDTVFVLLTTEQRQIIDTVLSRCMIFNFRKISVLDIISRLSYICQQESLDLEPQLLMAIAERADGGMRDAVMTLDQVTRVGVTSVSAFQELMGETDFAPTLIAAMLTGNDATIHGIVENLLHRIGDYSLITAKMSYCFRDIMVLKAGGVVQAQGRALQQRQLLAQRIDRDLLVAAVKVMWDMLTKVKRGTDQRSALDLAVVMCTEALRPKSSLGAAVVVGNGHQKLSLDQLRELTPQ